MTLKSSQFKHYNSVSNTFELHRVIKKRFLRNLLDFQRNLASAARSAL